MRCHPERRQGGALSPWARSASLPYIPILVLVALDGTVLCELRGDQGHTQTMKFLGFSTPL
jgi:hypothetical protein